jgi:SH3 domain-containing protein
VELDFLAPFRLIGVGVAAATLLTACSGSTGAGASRASSPSHPGSPNPSPFESCAASAAPPAVTASASASPAASPSTVWVNDPLGVSLRDGPATTNRRLGIVPQGASASVLGSRPDASGPPWYQVQWNSTTGWINGAYVVTEPVRLLTGGGWGLLIPSSAAVTPNSAGTVSEVRLADDPDLPFLQIALGDYPVPMPQILLTNIVPPVPQTLETFVVWSYTIPVAVSRVALNMCGVRNHQRSDGGWPWMYEVNVRTSVRSYHFVFFTSQPDAPLLRQMVASISLN